MRFGEVVKKIEKLDLMVQTHQYCYEFQYYYELKYCDVVIRVFKEWLKIDNCDNKNQWEFSIDLDKINNFSIDEKDNSYLIKIKLSINREDCNMHKLQLILHLQLTKTYVYNCSHYGCNLQTQYLV